MKPVMSAPCKKDYLCSGSPFSRSRSAVSTTEPAGQAWIRPCRLWRQGADLTCAAPGKWRPPIFVMRAERPSAAA